MVSFVSVHILCFYAFFGYCLLCCPWQCNWLPGMTRLRYDVVCVELCFSMFYILSVDSFCNSVCDVGDCSVTV